VPRAALLSINARVHDTQPDDWEHPSLVQLWGPRFSAYGVAKRDIPFFTLGRLPDDERGRRRAEETADRLHAFLGGRRMTYESAGHQMGVNPNMLRYAAPTGTVLMRWDGARSPVIWSIERPSMEPADAQLELARRYLHVFGPGTATSFAQWAGIGRRQGASSFDRLGDELAPTRTPVGDGWILAADEQALTAPPGPTAAARLLPSGDAYTLLQGAERELLVPRAQDREQLWTPRVWPGALLVEGEIVGTWRRAQAAMSVSPWRRLTSVERAAVEAEAVELPLPGLTGPVSVTWEA